MVGARAVEGLYGPCPRRPQALPPVGWRLPAGPVADYLAGAAAKVDSAVEEHWALARSGASLAGPPGRAGQGGPGAGPGPRRPAPGPGAPTGPGSKAGRRPWPRSFVPCGTGVGQRCRLSARLSELSTQLEGVVASAGELVARAGAAGADLSSLSSELASLTKALDEARGIMATAPPGDPGS